MVEYFKTAFLSGIKGEEMKKKSMGNVRDVVLGEIREVLVNKGMSPAPEVTLSTRLFVSGSLLDSLDIAELIVRLEGLLGRDPFKDGAAAVRTVGDLISYYEKSGKKKV